MVSQVENPDSLRPLSALNQLIKHGDTDTPATIKHLKDAGLIKKTTKFVKVMLSGGISAPIKLSLGSIRVSAGAKKAIESVGGELLTPQ